MNGTARADVTGAAGQAIWTRVPTATTLVTGARVTTELTGVRAVCTPSTSVTR